MTHASLAPSAHADIAPLSRALISVSDKAGLEALAKILTANKVEILSTGGTAKALREYGANVVDVSEHTGFPEIMDGRVKTLHPAIHGGLLARRDNAEHVAAMRTHAIAPIDLVVVNLYPFEATIARGAGYEEAVENIDIGGPSMVRSAAKNHAFTTVLTDPADYAALQEELQAHSGGTSYNFRKAMAAKAFARTAAYDAAISQWFAGQVGQDFPSSFVMGGTLKQSLRYGENPHQRAAFYATGVGGGIASATQLQGKELSYNNINDADAALQLVAEFSDPAAVIIKHANPCGVAIGKDIDEAYINALACDPVSAFGGILAFNRPLTGEVAAQIAKLFVEAIIAPGFTAEAREALASKKNVRLLSVGAIGTVPAQPMIKSVLGGFLVQENDREAITLPQLKQVTKRAPTAAEMEQLLFAFRVCKHVKSNAIVLVKDKATVGIGAGQMSRVDSSRIAALKAADCKENPERAKGSVLASDAFFPFADGVLQAAEAGVTAIIQPGGSIRDEEVIAAADAHNIAMVFTGTRHFRH